MQLRGALILLVITISTVGGLRCYTCTVTEARSCTDTKSCAVIFDRCFSHRIDGYGVVTKGCQSQLLCGGAMACCEGDLCNKAQNTGPSVLLLLLLLLSSAMVTSL
ncbi:CD59 glycoprotein-like [Lampris incognitus]|uniref:CD59 glycoprotein-like n=1 Tax=Lampris incognitus TaxID=2546036 RepID=UPI0024B62EDE|nr:CD59 glycoprotein-like [Lampris incognitus]